MNNTFYTKSKGWLFCILSGLASVTGYAQNPFLHIDEYGNVSMDFAAAGNEYLLTHRYAPLQVAGMSNVTPYGWNLGRLVLQNLKEDLSTNWVQTYCMQDEVWRVQSGLCPALTVDFKVGDAKQTMDGGYIVCGNIWRDFETANCTADGGTLPPFFDPFIMKVDNAGKPVWFQRYSGGAWLGSIVEDPVKGYFIVCGKIAGSSNANNGFVMGVDGNGNTLWAFETHAPYFDDPGSQASSVYNEVTSYLNNGRQYFVLTGNAGHYFQISGYNNIGGVLVTTIDESGGIYGNYYISADNYLKVMQGAGVHDAHDNDVVIVGGVDENICGDKYSFNMLTLKINPLTQTMSFINAYADRVTYANSVVAGEKIAVTGTEYLLDVSTMPYVPYSQKLFLELDVSGGFLRYVSHDKDNQKSVAGTSIVYNSFNGYSVYSGITHGGSSLVKNSQGYDCVPNQDLEKYEIPYEYINNTAQYLHIQSRPDHVLEFPLSDNKSLLCGTGLIETNESYKLPGMMDEVELFPNPASEHTYIKVAQEKAGAISITIADVYGRIISETSGYYDAGSHDISIDNRSFANGTYFVKIRFNGKEIVKKLSVIK